MRKNHSTRAATRHVQRLDIQGLRAVAVLAVVSDHLIRWPSGGFVGVDIFFVVSGFLITGLLLREIDQTGTVSFLRFYERRAKRILPAAAVVIFATVVAARVLLSQADFKEVAKDGLASATFIGNWRFAVQDVDYFAQGTPPSPLQHFWSLGVEEQFYLVWPWLLLAIVLVTLPRSSSKRRSRVVACGAIALISIASFIWGVHETATSPDFAYFSTFSRAWELGVGALLAFVPAFVAGRFFRSALAYAGLLGIGASLFIVEGDSPTWPAPLATLPVLSTALVIIAGHRAPEYHSAAPWILRNPVASYVGNISYSLYLWHFPVSVLLLRFFAQDSFQYFTYALVIMFGCAVASYHFVENPARRANWFRPGAKSWLLPTRAWFRPVGALVVIAMLGAGGSFILAGSSPNGDGAPSGALPVDAISGDQFDPGVACWGAGSAARSSECAGALLERLSPVPVNLKQDLGRAYSCYIGPNQPVQDCHEGSDAVDAYRVALVGDSHAATLLPGLRPQLKRVNWSLDIFAGRECRLTAEPSREALCSSARPQINERLASGDYDLVIATGTRRGYLDPAKVTSVMTDIVDAGTQLVVVADPPFQSDASVACTTRIGTTADTNCGTRIDVATRLPDRMAVAARSIGVPVIDFTDYYCADGFCPAIIGNVLVFRDSVGHMSATWSRTLGPYLVREINEVAHR